ncbi:unnamed protein product [Cylicostephanus goldi]|uniref:Uncharacterized protein n=1 Tax=Cylicostephanus goldi TaxID=71465 RepID=A0A3P6TGU7_CYLGO|nr:unnamed protein product [Cylicostephanus goldi]
MRERDMERSDYGQLPGQDSEKIAKLESEKKALKTELLAKEKMIEDLNFRLEEETISKDFQIEELQKKLTSAPTESAPSAAEFSLDDSALEKRMEADQQRRDLEAKCAQLEEQLKNVCVVHCEINLHILDCFRYQCNSLTLSLLR